ncbi:DUF6252 family protein [Hymenobacter sp. 5317J-9]|uniref:DUF6252 family protein n=1 Tax=Hymenobacter sp. 5317J-9 TaxID=2932250 RepID=UPI001FD6BF8A|nr:DUF6252 family protein [Hymenobacter sp. 5317J-9]UOQ99480.1 DUF6252 family protein [Hymenobacter sp. 5317J-9]
MNNLFYALLLAALLAAGCKKDDPEAGLPPATHEGKNTGGCLINGERFVAAEYGGSLLSNPIPALRGGFSFDSIYTIDLNGQMNGKNTTVSLFFRSQKVGTYLLNKNTGYYPQTSDLYALNHAVLYSDNAVEVYGTDAQHIGQVVLEYANVQKGISAGTFEFTAVNQSNPNKTVTITSGRFDRKQ